MQSALRQQNTETTGSGQAGLLVQVSRAVD